MFRRAERLGRVRALLLDMSLDVTLFCGVFKFDGKGLNLHINPLILRLTGLWYGPTSKWRFWQHALYGLWTLWMLSMLFGLMVIGGSAAYVYRHDLVSIASNTCLFVQDIGTFIKALMFVSRRGALLRLVRRLDALCDDPVVIRGGIASRRTIALFGRKSMVMTTVFLSMGFVTYVAWMVSPALLGTGLDCWAAMRSVNDLSQQQTSNESSQGAKSFGETAGEHNQKLNNESYAFFATVHAGFPSRCPPPTLPAEGWFAFDFYRNPGYAFAYVFQIFCVYYMYIITSVIDTFFVSMMIYISAQLCVLASDIATFRDKCVRNLNCEECDIYDSYSDPRLIIVDQMKMERYLTDIVNFHQRIIYSADALQEVASALILVQFVISMTVMCMALYATTSSGSNHASTVKFAAYLATLFSQLLLYCWFGDEVTRMNEEVVAAAYGSGWVDGSPECKRRILFVILRAQKTLAFRGGAFYELSRNTFLNIVNASYSFFNLLMQVQN